MRWRAPAQVAQMGPCPHARPCVGWRVCVRQNVPLEKILPHPMQTLRRNRCQTRTRPREKACVYGVRVSGATIYPYARDPNVFIDPAGLEAQIVGHLAGGPVGRLTSPNSYHLAIQLNPGKDCDPGGVKTLGGQPSGNFANGNLVSKPNYPGDSKDIAYTQAIPTPEGMSDCEFLKRLIKASGTYCNCLKYSKPDVSMMPGVSDGNMPAGNYNSNSFVSGVIESAGGKPPVLQTGGAWQAPGYQNPVPISNNIAPVGSVYTAPAK